MASKEANKNEGKFDIGRALVYGAALFQAYHMGRMFDVYDPHGWSLGNVNFGGFLLGAILNVIVARTALRLPSLSATFESRKQLLPKIGKQADKQALKAHAKALREMTLAGVQSKYSVRGFSVLLVFSVLMVAPGLYIIWTDSLGAFLHPFVIGVMALVGAVAPDVAITVGGFISSDAVSDGQRRSATNSATLSDGQRPIQRRSATKPATVSVVEAKKYICSCEYETTNRYEFSGHTRTCVKYQEKKRAQLDPSLLIDPSKVNQ